ncbi:nitroreductase/quinone reductase family protein [Kribbella sp. CA-294648]|uniref:nitroreductase/quinone reductase family protein n=1 Tax=Kribbella sp. CA-294648 TaxID=3239948 RepID=UPI003D8FE74A
MTENKIDFRVFNKDVIEEFRSNAGKVGGVFDGIPLVLIITKGAKTGEDRVSPLAYYADGDRIAIAATYAGSDTHPAWYHNLVANPDLVVETGTDTYEATAAEVKGEERNRLFAGLVETNPRLGTYRTLTTRKIPVLAVERKRR